MSSPSSTPVLATPHADVTRTWELTLLRWDEKDAHDRMLACARSHEAYLWLASRYRETARRGDVIAQQRLALLQRVIELTCLSRIDSRPDEVPYRRVFGALIALLMLMGLGLALARAKANAPRSAPIARNTQQGSAMLVVLILIAAILAGAATLTQLQSSSTRNVDLSVQNAKAMHCAEAGLALGRTALASGWTAVNTALAAGTPDPALFSSVNRDIDGDGSNDFSLRVRDNDDESATNDPARDNDLSVFLLSTCIKYSDAPVAVSELVRFNGGVNCYEQQLGGCGGNNNAN